MTVGGPGAVGEAAADKAEGQREGRTRWCVGFGEIVVGGFGLGRVQPCSQAVLSRICPGGARSGGRGWLIRAASIFLP